MNDISSVFVGNRSFRQQESFNAGSHVQRKRKHSEKPNMADEVEALVVFFVVILGL